MEKIKVSAVSYLNSKPFIYGLENSEIINDIDLSLDIPSICAEKLLKGEIELGLVPVAIIPQLNKQLHDKGDRACLISDFCIGSAGSVKTVCIYSHIPIEQVKTVYLDYQSRTSVELAKILLKYHWNIEVRFIHGKQGYEKKISKTTAGLIIGDRAIEMSMEYEYEYDLGEAWKQMTGLPFVFAAWISNHLMPIDFTDKFNKSLKTGLTNIPSLALELQPNYPAHFNVLSYFQYNVSYNMNEEKRKGMEMFLDYLKNE